MKRQLQPTRHFDPILQLDHLVHAVTAPEEAANSFAERYHWRTVQGGEHKNWGTYNSLAYFGLSYVEWIGVRDTEVAQGTHFGRQIVESLNRGEGVSQLALRTRHMDELIADWTARGIAFIGPENGSRVRPDGQTIRWRLLYPKTDGRTSYRLPFVIEWGEPDGVRAVNLEDLRAADCQVSGVHAVVDSVHDTRAAFATYFGFLPVSFMEDGSYRRMTIQVGETALYFWEPRRDVSSPAVQEWLDYLHQQGERTVQLDLAPLDLAPLVTSGSTAQLTSPHQSLHGLVIQCP